jgi:hypothetical protein
LRYSADHRRYKLRLVLLLRPFHEAVKQGAMPQHLVNL